MNKKINCELDHLVIGAETLDQGCDFIGDLFGERPHPGGEHPNMGTHNALMHLGGTVYLEVIAINPDAAPAAWPRWFSLDEAKTRLFLKDQPRLITWVARTHHIEMIGSLDDYAQSSVRSMSRGDLAWQFAFSADGRCIADGLLPHVIQWQSDEHPTDAMLASPVRLLTLRGYAPDANNIQSVINKMGLSSVFTCDSAKDGQVKLTAEFTTPKGVIKL